MSSYWVQVRPLQQHVLVLDHPPSLVGVHGTSSAQEKQRSPTVGMQMKLWAHTVILRDAFASVCVLF